MSITLTSATNVACFAVGAATANYGTVYYFCAYCAWLIATIYALTMTAFGSILVVLRLRLAAVAVDVCCCRSCFRVWRRRRGGGGGGGGGSGEGEGCCGREGVPAVAAAHLGRFLASGWGQVAVAAVFVVYVVVSANGVTQLRDGLDRRKMLHDASYASSYYVLEEDYFRNYQYRLQVAFVLRFDRCLSDNLLPFRSSSAILWIIRTPPCAAASTTCSATCAG